MLVDLSGCLVLALSLDQLERGEKGEDRGGDREGGG